MKPSENEVNLSSISHGSVGSEINYLYNTDGKYIFSLKEIIFDLEL